MLPNSRLQVNTVLSPSFIMSFVKKFLLLSSESPNISLCGRSRRQIQTSTFPVSAPGTCTQNLLFTNSQQHSPQLFTSTHAEGLEYYRHDQTFFPSLVLAQMPLLCENVFAIVPKPQLFLKYAQFTTEQKQMCL